ncbi:MAG: hypothetical protein WCS70_11180 [Verrucomicrobiota bacterium]
MGRDGIAGLFNANRSVTNFGGEARQMRLPTMSQFPKLDQRIVRPSASAQPMRTGGAVVLSGGGGFLPEMASDVLGVDAGYAVENVKRNRVEVQPVAKSGLAHLVGRMMGSSQAAGR